MSLPTHMSNGDDAADPDRFARLSEMFDRSPVALTLADARAEDLPLVVANRGFLELTSYAQNEVLGRNCRFLQADLANEEARAEVRACIREGGLRQVVFHNRRKTGEAFENLLFLQPLVARDGHVDFFLGSQFVLDRSVTERRIDRHMREIDVAVAQVVEAHERLRAEQRRMLNNAAYAVANAWLALR